MEVGIGFVVACLPPCAQLLDRVSLRPILSQFRSMSSLLSFSKRSRVDSSQLEGTKLHDLEANKSWTLTQRNESLTGQEDELGLVTVVGRY